MDTKQWYESKEVWAALLSVVARLLQWAFNVEVISLAIQAELTTVIIVLLRLFFTDKPTNVNLKRIIIKRRSDLKRRSE